MAKARVKTNDEMILELKKQVEEKREKIAKCRTFVSISNCNLELDGQRFNLRTLKKEQVIHLLVKLNIYRDTSDKLNLTKDYVIGGYHINIWLTDLDNLLENLSIRDEENDLKDMETTLTELLSNDKKVEMQLEKIKNKLKV